MPAPKKSPHRAASEELRREIAANLRTLRTQVGQSQEALAAAAGVSVQMIRRLEAGTANPTIGTLEAIAAGLQRRFIDLVKETER